MFLFNFTIAASLSRVFARLLTEFQRTSMPLGGRPRAKSTVNAQEKGRGYQEVIS
jgi:hypothetical protein